MSENLKKKKKRNDVPNYIMLTCSKCLSQHPIKKLKINMTAASVSIHKNGQMKYHNYNKIQTLNLNSNLMAKVPYLRWPMYEYMYLSEACLLKCYFPNERYTGS